MAALDFTTRYGSLEISPPSQPSPWKGEGGTLQNSSFSLRNVLVTQLLAAALIVTLLVGCSNPKEKANGLPQAAHPAVTAAMVIQRATPMTTDVVAEIKAYQEVDLRPRVTGVIDKIYFKPGQEVMKDQLLFLIDPRSYAAAVEDALAGVLDAEASLARIRQDVERYRPLVAENAIPKQIYEQTLQQEKQARALVASRRAQLERVELDLSYTKVRSPVDGQIGLQKIEEGAFASAGNTVLATVSTMDPVHAYFSIPESVYVDFVQRFGGRANARNQADRPIEMFLPDGSRYPSPGQLDFVERTVNASTGTLQLRARFSNADGLLKPGLNVRLRLNPETVENALLVPQRAVGDLLGKQYVLVLSEGDKVEQRFVTMGERSGELWIVREGLKAGERIVVDGLQKAQPGQIVVAKMLQENEISVTKKSVVAEQPTRLAAKQ